MPMEAPGGDVPALRACLRNARTDFVPAVAAEREPLCIDLCGPPDLLAGELVVTARNVYDDRTVSARASATAAGAGVVLDLPPSLLPLSPGCWHVRIEAPKGLPGSLAVYARRPDESQAFSRAGYNLGYAEFGFDRTDRIYYKTWRETLPESGDPFDPSWSEGLRAALILEERTAPELQHDGGLGFLMAAHVYHALGEGARAAYCERAVRRTVDVIGRLMHDGEGKLWLLDTKENGRRRTRHSRQQDGFALKFLSQAAVYFARGAGADAGYAAEVLDLAGRLYDYTIREPLECGCGAVGCLVYDGRILAGISWYALACKTLTGSWPKYEDRPIHTAVRMARQVLANRGWYDAGCLVEETCHTWCGNMNVLNGLLAARRIVRSRSGEAWVAYTAEHLDAAIREAWRFLTHTSGAVTGLPAFVPTQVSQWAAGNMVEICEDHFEQFGEDPALRRLQEHLVLGAGSGFVSAFHRNNASGGVLMTCPEYRSLQPRPSLPWHQSLIASGEQP